MRVDRLFIFDGRIKGKSVEEREFRLQRKQNPFRAKCLPVIGGNSGLDRNGFHHPPADRVSDLEDFKGTHVTWKVLIEFQIIRSIETDRI